MVISRRIAQLTRGTLMRLSTRLCLNGDGTPITRRRVGLLCWKPYPACYSPHFSTGQSRYSSWESTRYLHVISLCLILKEWTSLTWSGSELLSIRVQEFLEILLSPFTHMLSPHFATCRVRSYRDLKNTNASNVFFTRNSIKVSLQHIYWWARFILPCWLQRSFFPAIVFHVSLFAFDSCVCVTIPLRKLSVALCAQNSLFFAA